MVRPKVFVYAHIYVGLGQNSGGDTTIHDVLKAMVADGWQADVLVYNAPFRFDDFVIDGVRVHQEKNRRDILSWIPESNLVLTHLDGTERSCLVAKKFRVPVVQYIHNDMAPTHVYVGMKCDLAVFNTDWISARYPEYSGARMVLHPPVDPNLYKAPLNKNGAVMQVNLWPNKGSDVFYDCADALPDVQFATIYGGYGVQDIREGYANVTHYPQQNPMRDGYAKAKIILMPSKYESFGRIAVEGLASGIPAVVCPTPGLKEALGDAGIFAETKDDFVREITRLRKPAAYNAASKKCLKRSAELWEQSQEEMKQFLILAKQIMETSKLLRGW